MEPIRLSMDRDIHFRYIYTDKFKSNLLTYTFLVPLKEDTAAGYALIPHILRCGTRRYPSRAALNKRLEELYATSLNCSVDTRGSLLLISFSLDVLEDRFTFERDGTLFENAVALLHEVLFSPLYDEKENGFSAAFFTSEREKQKQRIDSVIDNKLSYARMRSARLTYGGGVAGMDRMGSKETLDGYTPASLYALWQRMLYESVIEIGYVGSSDRAHVLEKIQCLLPKSRTNVPRLPCPWFSFDFPETVRRFTEEIEANQSVLVMTFRAAITPSDSLYGCAAMFNEIYGGNAFSKLFMNLREKQGLCYTCSSICIPFHGAIVVCAGIDAKDAKAAEKEVLLQLKKMQQGRITPEEMQCARHSLVGFYAELEDDPAALERWYTVRGLSDSSATHTAASELQWTIKKEELVRLARGMRLDTVYLLKGNGTASGEQEDFEIE